MIPILLAAALQTSAAPSLTFTQTEYVVRTGDKEQRVSFAADPDLGDPIQLTFRKDETYVRWEAGRLKIENGGTARSFTLADIALTPKLFSKEQITKTKELMAQGKRKKEADSLSGTARVGNFVYLLPRWTESSGAPWLEALIRVDLTAARPVPELLGRYEGLSLARGPADGRLLITRTGLAVYVVKPDGAWGSGSYAVSTGKFTFAKLGTGLLDIATSEDGLLIAERTPYGRVVVSRAGASPTDPRTELAEMTGPVRILSRERPYVVMSGSNLGSVARNLETGAVLLVPPGSQTRRTKAGMIVWPGTDPSKGVLYSYERFLRLATAKPAAAAPPR